AGEVEDEDELVANRTVMGDVRAVEQIAPAAVGRLPGGPVAEREEHAAGVRVEPEDLERAPHQVDRADPDERDVVAGARWDLIPLHREIADLRAKGEARVVLEKWQSLEGRALLDGQRRLRMGAEE